MTYSGSDPSYSSPELDSSSLVLVSESPLLNTSLAFLEMSGRNLLDVDRLDILEKFGVLGMVRFAGAGVDDFWVRSDVSILFMDCLSSSICCFILHMSSLKPARLMSWEPRGGRLPRSSAT